MRTRLKAANTALSRVRIFIEHAIGGMKRYNILVHTFRNRIEHFEDDVIGICAGLWNLVLSYSDVVFWRVPHELASRHDCLLLGKQIGKELFRSLPELESFVRIQHQGLHEGLGLLATRFPNGFEG